MTKKRNVDKSLAFPRFMQLFGLTGLFLTAGSLTVIQVRKRRN